MSEIIRTSYDHQFQEITIQKSCLIKSSIKKRSICAIRSEDAVIKRRLLHKSRDMPQRRLSLDLQYREGTYGLKRVRMVPNISDRSLIQLLSTGCWKHAVALFGVDRIFLL